MPTIAQTFWASTDAWDGTIPSGGDIQRARPESAVGNVNTTLQNFGTAIASIVADPFTNRTTTGTADSSKFGWGIDLLGTGGMESTSTDKRIFSAGVWHAIGALATQATGFATVNYTVTANVYRYKADGTRVLLWSATSGNMLPVVGAPVGFDISSASQPVIVLEAGESMTVSFTVNKTATSIVGEGVRLPTAGIAGSELRVVLPGPVAFKRIRSHSATLTLSAAARRTIRLHPIASTVNLAAVFDRRITASRSFSATTALTAAFDRRITASRSFASTLTLTAVRFVKIRPAAKQATLSLTAVKGPLVLRLRNAGLRATLTLNAAASKLVRKTISATLFLDAVFNRRYLGRRSFSANLTLGASMLVKMSQTVLNRITSGVSTTVNKFFLTSD